MRITKTELFTIFSIFSPYIFILFFFRLAGIFGFLGLLGLSIFLILSSLLILVLTENTKFKKVFYFILTVISIVFFLSYRNELIDKSDKIFFAIHKSQMLEIVSKIEKVRLKDAKFKIPQPNFATVDTLEQGEVIFTLDGMLDNCVGIAYSKENQNPGYTNCGRIIEWKKLEEHWYLWYTV